MSGGRTCGTWVWVGRTCGTWRYGWGRTWGTWGVWGWTCPTWGYGHDGPGECGVESGDEAEDGNLNGDENRGEDEDEALLGR